MITIPRNLRWKVAVSCLIGLARIAASLLFVGVCKMLVDIATGVSDTPLGLAIGFFVGIMLLQVASGTAYQYWLGRITVQTQNEMRQGLFSKILHSEWTGKDSVHSGDYVNRIEEDVRVVVELLCDRIPDVAITVVQLIAASIYLIVLQPGLAWVILILMPVAVIGSRLFFKTQRRLSARIRESDSRIQGHVQESIQNRMLVKVFGVEKMSEEKMAGMQDELEHTTYSRLGYNAIARSFMSFGFAGGYAAAFIWGVVGIRSGAVTFGMMTAFLQLVGQVQRPIADIARHIPAFIHALTSIDRIKEIEALPSDGDGSMEILDETPGILVDNVSFAYPDAPSEMVLSGLSHDFKPGTVTAITGQTGAGKSTLIKLILGILKPVSGSVKLYPGDVPASPAALGNFMYVPQGNSLMSGTVRENLRLACPDASEEEMKAALHVAVADFILDLPDGLDTLCSEKGGGLSEGQAQRIAIARALLHSGGIIILDEATSALDPETETVLLDRLRDWSAGRKTVIWITHRPAVTAYTDAELHI